MNSLQIETQSTSYESSFDDLHLTLSLNTADYLVKQSIKSIFISHGSHILSFRIKTEISQELAKYSKTPFRLSLPQFVAIKVMNCCNGQSDVLSQFQKIRSIFNEPLKIKTMKRMQREITAQTAENKCILYQSLAKIQKSLIIRMLYQPDIKNVMEITTKKTITRTQYQTFDKYITKKVVTKQTFFTNEVKLIEESVLKNISLKNLGDIQKLKSLTDYESIMKQHDDGCNEIEHYKMEDEQFIVDGVGDKKKKKKRKNKRKIDSIQDYASNDEKLCRLELAKTQSNTSDQMLNPEYCSLEEKAVSFQERFQEAREMLKRKAKEIENQKQKNDNIVIKNIKQFKIDGAEQNEIHDKENQVETDTSNEVQMSSIDPQIISQKENQLKSQKIRLDKYKEELERERKELLRDIQKFKKEKETEELYMLALKKNSGNKQKQEREKQKKQQRAKQLEQLRLIQKQKELQLQEKQKVKQEKIERERRLRQEKEKQRIQNQKKIGLCEQEKSLTIFLQKLTIDDLSRSACHVEESFKEKWILKLDEIRNADFVNFQKLNHQMMQKKKKPNPIARRNRNQQRRK